MWNNIKSFCRWFRKVIKMKIAFRWFWPLLKFCLFEWRFADWPWNVVIPLGFQVPVPFFYLIFGIYDTCRCEITWKIIADSTLVFAFFREKHCVWYAVLQILPEWRWRPYILIIRAGLRRGNGGNCPGPPDARGPPGTEFICFK